MFDPSITNEPNPDRRRDLMATAMTGLLKLERLFVTPVLMLGEPFKSNALEVLDGVNVEGGVPRYNSGNAFSLPSARLVPVKVDGHSVVYDRNGSVAQKVVVREVVPGTNQTVLERREKRHPAGAVVTLDSREARRILVANGWPVKDHKSKGSRRGTVVELDWLEDEAKQPTASPAVKGLLASIHEALTVPAAKTDKPGREARP